MRYVVAAVAAFAFLAAAVAYETREPSRTKVPAIELVSVQVIEPAQAEGARPVKQRKERKGAERGAAPARAPAPVPAGDDDGDDDGD